MNVGHCILGKDYVRLPVNSKHEKTTPQGKRRRLIALMSVLLLWTGITVSRLYSLQISDFVTWQQWALRQHSTEINITSERGTILDRNGKFLAVSVPAASVYVRPWQVKNGKDVERELSRHLEIQPERIRQSLSKEKPFVWVKRQIPRIKAAQIEGAKLEGVGYVMESRRFYPYNHAASVLIGKVGVDGSGLSGFEQLYDTHLRGQEVKARLTRDAFGKMIYSTPEENAEFRLPKGGSLSLTLDVDIQVIVDEELEGGRRRAKARGAMAVLVDADTGEILALSQAPLVNFNGAQALDPGQLKNRVSETVFEPGSVLKPFVLAGALEDGVVSPNETIECEHGSFRVGRHIINDVHPYDELALRDVIVRSSNIGMAKIGMRMGKDNVHRSLLRFGFGKPTDLGIPGETQGLLRDTDAWAAIDAATHAYGQGVAVTPLQLARAVSAIANGGVLNPLRLIRQPVGSDEGVRVISAQTAQRIRDMLLGVVADEHGTGHAAAVPGVLVGGKTGTAQMARHDERGYQEGAYMSSFVGFVDGAALGLRKTLSLVIVVEEPHGKSYYGGAVAAPIFKRIAQRTLHLLATKSNLGFHKDDGVTTAAGGMFVNVSL